MFLQYYCSRKPECTGSSIEMTLLGLRFTTSLPVCRKYTMSLFQAEHSVDFH